MDLIIPPIEAIFTDKATCRQIPGHIVAVRMIAELPGHLGPGKQYMFKPVDSPSFWMKPFPVLPTLMKYSNLN